MSLPRPPIARVESLEERRLFAATLVHQELHRPPPGITADINGDGQDDIARIKVGPNAAGVWSVYVETLINNGDGTFSPGKDADCSGVEGEVLAVDLATGDINGDGAPDLALFIFSEPAGLSSAPGIRAQYLPLFGDGSGGFTQGKSHPIPHVLEANPPRRSLENTSIHLGDLDGDGLDDLVSVTQTELVAVTLDIHGGPRQTTSQDGTFSFGPGQPGTRFIGLLDDDTPDDPAGGVDFKTHDGLAVSLQDGKVTLEKWSVIGGFQPVGTIDGILVAPDQAVWIGDFDGDGADDDIAIDTDLQAILLISNPDSLSFRRLSGEIAGPSQELLVGDLDGDGVDDLFAVAKQKPKPTASGQVKHKTGHVTLIK